MKTLGRITSIGISVCALVGEITRLTRFDGAVGGYLFGWEYQQSISRLAYTLTVMFGILLFFSGIFSALLHGTTRTRLLKVVSGLAVAIFIIRPFVWIVFYRIEYGGASFEDIGNEIRAWWFNYPISFGATKFASTLSGVVLFLLLISNLVLALIAKRDIHEYSTRGCAYPVFHDSYTAPPVYQQPQYVQPPQPPVQPSMIAELAELERMFESGALTKPEFTAAKKRVLGQ